MAGGEGSGNAGGNALSARTGRLSGGKPHGGDGLPVCGATHHPHKAALTENAITQAEWQEKKAQEETASAALRRASEQAKVARGKAALGAGSVPHRL